MSDKYKVEISNRAMRGMQIELSSWPSVETGGVLLGYRTPDSLIIHEAIDGGYTNVKREQGQFAFDHQYVNHVCNYVANLYNPALELLGYWHKHNHSDDPPFSTEDIETHEILYEKLKRTGCSILFQKNTKDNNSYIMRVFLFKTGSDYYEISQTNIFIR